MSATEASSGEPTTQATTAGTRFDADSLGRVAVPAEALWGPQTQRAVENFPVSGLRLPRRMIRALALIKRTAAEVNGERGALPAATVDAIVRAADEVAAGRHDAAFPVDVFQTGSGTSSHMNVNEVLANRANQLLGAPLGGKSPVHPNDHVNKGQSSNDVFPTAAHVAACEAVAHDLLPALRHLEAALERKAVAFDAVVKIGRTHLMDAVPIRLGQEFAGYAQQVKNSVRRVETASAALAELPLGGTAVGTGFGADPAFAPAVIARLAASLGLPFRQAPNLCEALAARDALVEASASLRSTAVSLTKVANDVRWLGSGPRCAIGELQLPDLQPGSSIMPGKVNPVMAEMLLMICAQVVGLDAAIAWAGASGNFELNTNIPLIAFDFLHQAELLSNGVRLFADRCVEGLVANEERCRSFVDLSLAMATALNARIGYDAAAALAREAVATGKTVRALCLEKNIVPAAELDQLLDPLRMTGPTTAA